MLDAFGNRFYVRPREVFDAHVLVALSLPTATVDSMFESLVMLTERSVFAFIRTRPLQTSLCSCTYSASHTFSTVNQAS